MRRGLVLALLIAALGVVGALAIAGGDDPTVPEPERLSERGTSTPAGSAERPRGAATLDTREVKAGEVTVVVEPRRIDVDGAEIELSFDTHSVELDFDVVESVELTVDGQAWRAREWDGDGPGGHHREGTVRFEAGGSASGAATFTMSGLPEPVEVSWTLPPT